MRIRKIKNTDLELGIQLIRIGNFELFLARDRRENSVLIENELGSIRFWTNARQFEVLDYSVPDSETAKLERWAEKRRLFDQFLVSSGTAEEQILRELLLP